MKDDGDAGASVISMLMKRSAPALDQIHLVFWFYWCRRCFNVGVLSEFSFFKASMFGSKNHAALDLWKSYQSYFFPDLST